MLALSIREQFDASPSKIFPGIIIVDEQDKLSSPRGCSKLRMLVEDDDVPGHSPKTSISVQSILELNEYFILSQK